jgi:peroxiredoxin
MALLHTPEKLEAFQAPDFSLQCTTGKTHTLESTMGENGLVVAFICNHCPYVKAIVDRLASDAKALQSAGIGVIAIMPNDTDNYPEDSFDNMKKFAKQHGFTFPYVIDETQKTAKAYGAICTPDLFGFDREGMLQYRGRLDSAANKPADANTKRELLEALLQVAQQGIAPAQQSPSMGCSIKWR